MSSPFKVGDWVTWGSRTLIVQIERIREKSVLLTSGHEVAPTALIPMRISLPKPRRKLTLSQGLAWFPLNLGISKTSGGLFEIYQFGEGRVVAVGPTLLKAIIAARKILKVSP